MASFLITLSTSALTFSHCVSSDSVGKVDSWIAAHSTLLMGSVAFPVMTELQIKTSGRSDSGC